MQLKSLAKQTVIYGLPSIVGRFLNFLLVPLYTYTFAPAEYGIVTELYAYVALLLVLLTYGMETTFFRFMQKYNQDPDVFSTAVWSLAATTALFLALVLGFSPRIASGLGYSETRYISWFAVILACDVMAAVPFCLLRNQNKAARFALLKCLNIAVNIFFNLFFIVYCPHRLSVNPQSWLTHIYSPSMGVGYIFISNLLASSVTVILLSPEWAQLRLRFNKKMWREMMVYTLPVMIWGIAGAIDGTFDRIFFKFLVSDPAAAMYQLGIYGACAKLAIIMTLFVQAFKYAAEPFFFKQMDSREAPQTYALVMRWFVIACSFIYLICVLFLDQIIYFIGKGYHEGRTVVPVLLMANLFLGIFYNLSIWYKITDKTQIGMYISFIGAAVTIALNMLLIPFFGYKGAAWTIFSTYLILCVVSYLWGQKCYPVPYPLKRIFLYLSVSVILCLPSLYIGWPAESWKLLYNFAATAVFAGFILKAEPSLPGSLKKIIKQVVKH